MKLFSVRDMKGQCFLTPHFQRSVADAIRQFEVVANEGESLISRFPNDFRLVHLADFDSDSGRLDVFETAKDLGSAADFLRRPAVQEGLFPTPMKSAAPAKEAKAQ